MDDHESQYHQQQLEWHRQKQEQQLKLQQLQPPDQDGRPQSSQTSSSPPPQSPKSLRQPPLTTPKNVQDESGEKKKNLFDDQPGLEPAPWSTAPIPYTTHADLQSPVGQCSAVQSPATLVPGVQSPGSQTPGLDSKWLESQLYAVPPDPESPPLPPPNEKRRILGLAVPVFWAVVIGLVIIVAAGLAGGVAGGLITQKANASSSSVSPDAQSDPTATSALSITSNPSATTSATATSATPRASGGVLPAPTDGGCPKINSTNFTPTDASGEAMGLSSGAGQTFRQLCEVNYPSGAAYGNPGIYDILKAYVSTFDECMTLCAAHNQAYYLNLSNGNVGKGGFCRSVAMIKTPGEYCYLKNGTGVSDTQGHPKDFVSAVVVSGLDV
ncbi:hypothetical protein CkaCkLH20_05569 [Colletotrichum karsti]|uniref:Apple domain-containing protein n=1 Tax=Colletotrichum karsti TaxID=1095194 RepID=A0A9P6I5E5_9PEZI|nr:uncharacterized protein CkaCkLH20_05569 [Colletotrichum karsti]KAF9876723.1 hypothetical protein CkaCkLH20_05569 [Colletotrichum karsti]